jgi:hypothetical protein
VTQELSLFLQVGLLVCRLLAFMWLSVEHGVLQKKKNVLNIYSIYLTFIYPESSFEVRRPLLQIE